MSSKRFGLRAAFSVAVLAWVIHTTDAAELITTMREADARYLLIGGGLYFGSDLLSAKKLQVFLRSQRVSLASVWKYYYLGKLFNSFLPTTIGGDAVKARAIERRFDEFNAYSAVFMERFTGLLALLGITIAATMLFTQSVPFFVYLAVYAVFLPTVLVVSSVMWIDRLSSHVRTLIRRIPGSNVFGIGERIIEFHATVERYKSAPYTVGLGLLLSVAVHVLLIVACIAFATGVGMTVAPVYFFVFIPVASVLLFLPISIGGFGVREAIYLYFFTQVGAMDAEAVSLALLLNGMLVLSAALGGLIYVRAD